MAVVPSAAVFSNTFTLPEKFSTASLPVEMAPSGELLPLMLPPDMLKLWPPVT